MPNLSRHRKRKHAIVVGGSMAGLLATRVFADYFEQVTTVERDRFPAMGEQRRGVPQGRHTHGLLASGRRILDELFPGICFFLALTAKPQWSLQLPETP
jgi:hypothetical protein